MSQINFEEIDSYIKTEFRYESHETIQEIKCPTPNYSSINEFIQQSDDILQDNIRKIILSKQLDEIEVYKKSRYRPQTFLKDPNSARLSSEQKYIAQALSCNELRYR